MEVVEKYIQIPLPEEYIDKLTKRAAERDRVMSREGSRILKDVLDGRYELRVAAAPVEVVNQDAQTGGIIAARGADRTDFTFIDDPAAPVAVPDAGQGGQDAASDRIVTVCMHGTPVPVEGGAQ